MYCFLLPFLVDAQSNGNTKPALFRANTPSKEFYLWLYTQVYYYLEFSSEDESYIGLHVHVLEFDTSAEVSNSIQIFNCEIILLSQKPCYFSRGSRFSQCFIPSTAIYCSFPSNFLCYSLFWVITNSVHVFKTRTTWWQITMHSPCDTHYYFRHFVITDSTVTLKIRWSFLFEQLSVV